MSTTKETPQVNTVSLDSEERTFGDPQWRTGMKARFPWTGFTALCTILLCANSSVIILLLTDGHKQRKWAEKIGPSVWLSAFNGIANICFGIAIANGVAITWWRKALRGATIKELHRSWQFSASIKDVVLYGKYFNFIALAALAAKLTIIDGILLQKAASSEYGVDPVHKTKATLYANDTMPFTASIGHPSDADRSSADGYVGNLNDWFNAEVEAWPRNLGSFTTDTLGIVCTGTCLFSVPGTGFGVDCQTEELAIDYGKILSQAASEQAALTNDSSASLTSTDRTLFEVSFAALYGATGVDGNYSSIAMNVTFTNTTQSKDDPNSCPGTLTRHRCILRPAIVKYPVTVMDNRQSKDQKTDSIMYLGYNTTSYGGQIYYTDTGSDDYYYKDDAERFQYTQRSAYDPKGHQLVDYEVHAYKDVLEEDPSVTKQSSTAIGGFNLALAAKLSGSDWLNSLDGQFFLSPYGLAADLQFKPAYDTTTLGCGYQYQDPLDYVIRRINLLMFILSVDPGMHNSNNNNYSKQTTVDAKEYGQSLHYKTNRGFMYGALASILVCVLCVIPSYWGYWQLGRDVTLGPFEIANAFRAPILDHPSVANAGVKVLIREVGEREVKYGEMVQNDASGRLAIAEPEAVRRVHPRIYDRSM
jgi:hypothetical protein